MKINLLLYNLCFGKIKFKLIQKKIKEIKLAQRLNLNLRNSLENVGIILFIE